MDDLTSRAALERLAQMAVGAMLGREPVIVVHAIGFERPANWPLPIKRVPDGLPQCYRPLAILEYVEWALSQETNWRGLV